MFALPGLMALILVDYLRPQEYLPFLSGVPLLHIASGLAALGLVLDLRASESRPRPAPHLVLAILFFVWCVGTVIVHARDQVFMRASALLTPIVIYALVAHCILSLRALQAVCALLLAICLVLAVIGVEQGLSPYGCHRMAVSDGSLVYLYDGRPCSDGNRKVCEQEGAEPGADYVCEKIGLVGTQSDHGRVRFRGTLQDPNELSLALGIAVPFAFAFFDRRRSFPRLLVVLGTCALVGMCAYFTQSRGGQIVFLAVLGVYFLRRLGAGRGFLIVSLLALPVLLFLGRSGGDASTIERTECWWVGLDLFRGSPILGVGYGQFTEHHYLTAHNSLILTAAELGTPGMLLWSSIIYLAAKIPVQALRAQSAPAVRSTALAMLASITGLIVGSLFLSYSYKDVLWIYVGLTGALYQAIRRQDPGFEVKFGARDLGIVALVDFVLLLALGGFTRLKLD